MTKIFGRLVGVAAASFAMGADCVAEAGEYSSYHYRPYYSYCAPCSDFVYGGGGGGYYRQEPLEQFGMQRGAERVQGIVADDSAVLRERVVIPLDEFIQPGAPRQLTAQELTTWGTVPPPRSVTTPAPAEPRPALPATTGGDPFLDERPAPAAAPPPAETERAVAPPPATPPAIPPQTPPPAEAPSEDEGDPFGDITN